MSLTFGSWFSRIGNAVPPIIYEQILKRILENE